MIREEAFQPIVETIFTSRKDNENPEKTSLNSTGSCDVSFSRRVAIKFQSWEFFHSEKLVFSPMHTDIEKKRLISEAYDLCHKIVNADIKATLFEIEKMVGECFELTRLAESVGVQSNE